MLTSAGGELLVRLSPPVDLILNRLFDLCPCALAGQVQRFALNFAGIIPLLVASDQSSFLALKQGLTSGRFPNPYVSNEPLGAVGSSSPSFCCRAFLVVLLACGAASPSAAPSCPESPLPGSTEPLRHEPGRELGTGLGACWACFGRT